MDEFVMNAIANLPNFGVALLMLFWQQQTIKLLLDAQQKHIDRLFEMSSREQEDQE